MNEEEEEEVPRVPPEFVPHHDANVAVQAAEKMTKIGTFFFPTAQRVILYTGVYALVGISTPTIAQDHYT